MRSADLPARLFHEHCPKLIMDFPRIEILSRLLCFLT